MSSKNDTFSFYSKQQEQQEQQTSSRPIRLPTESGQRDHHWAMTRIILPRFLREDVAAVFTEHLRQDGRKMVADTWDDFGRSTIKDPADVIPSEEIAVFIDHTAKGTEIITIQMPMPLYRNETYFMAIVCQAPPDNYRTFSLEYSVLPQGGQPFTMLTGICNGSRSNYGPGPAPGKEAFINAVTRILNEDQAPMTTFDLPAMP
ncbi:hypothetical protein [Undibacterium sp.]|uniref:hypothetical protein n=1 Tax=Undibacterium sp. TaxID=1914977 RepID=UPI0027312573|nr:hypothetical protein [Undibacterium sp.]MDP1980515.1 hypothetical protein [Undibacterium sp.]